MDRSFQDIFNEFYYQILFCPWLFYRHHRTTVHSCRRQVCRGCKRTAKCLHLVKIQANSLKIQVKSMEICVKYVKIFAKSLNIWKKMAPNVCRITWKLFLEVIPKEDLLEKMNTEKVPQNFSVKFGEIQKKILRALKNLLASTPMPHYVYFMGFN